MLDFFICTQLVKFDNALIYRTTKKSMMCPLATEGNLGNKVSILKEMTDT